MPPPVDFGPHFIPRKKIDLLVTLKEAGDIAPLKLSSSIPRQTLLQLNQYLQLAVQHSQVNMTNSNIAIRHLLRIADTNITYLMDILLVHIQRLRTK